MGLVENPRRRYMPIVENWAGGKKRIIIRTRGLYSPRGRILYLAIPRLPASPHDGTSIG
jgi:hypothetical protein